MILFPLGLPQCVKHRLRTGDPVIFLFMGGFILALGLERHNLHTRIALNLIRLYGHQRQRDYPWLYVINGTHQHVDIQHGHSHHDAAYCFFRDFTVFAKETGQGRRSTLQEICNRPYARHCLRCQHWWHGYYRHPTQCCDGGIHEKVLDLDVSLPGG